ncbi:MAG: hypothetical protein DRG78_03825 [Epsilonproteobacteria bacterium]|nr:MAG: hypothetical protein DRG78_03825 [Campylobacterota bacterium]
MTKKKEEIKTIEESKSQSSLENFDKPITQADMQRMMANNNANKIVLGATFASLETIIGKDIIDKKTNQTKVDADGIVQKYNDKYYASFTFDGGAVRTELTHPQSIELQEGVRYLCTGRLAPVNVFGKLEIQPVFSKYERLF